MRRSSETEKIKKSRPATAELKRSRPDWIFLVSPAAVIIWIVAISIVIRAMAPEMPTRKPRIVLTKAALVYGRQPSAVDSDSEPQLLGKKAELDVGFALEGVGELEGLGETIGL